MAHFKRLPPEVMLRLAERGIDPEQSCERFLEAIRAGDFPLTANGLPRRPQGRSWWKTAEARAA